MEDVLNTMKKCSRNHHKREYVQKLLDLTENSVGIPDDGTFAFRIKENVKRISVELNTLKEIEEKIIEAAKDKEDV